MPKFNFTVNTDDEGKTIPGTTGGVGEIPDNWFAIPDFELFEGYIQPVVAQLQSLARHSANSEPLPAAGLPVLLRDCSDFTQELECWICHALVKLPDRNTAARDTSGILMANFIRRHAKQHALDPQTS